jgi:ribonuclease HII
MPSWLYERNARQEGYKAIAGVDEAGRGPLAGPVVAAAVVLPDNYHTSFLDDSKKLSVKKRELLFQQLQKSVRTGIGLAEPAEIEELNILNATFLAMRRALAAIGLVDYILVDGKFPISSLCVPQKPIIGGDAASFSIAAASIIAKVTRDRLMDDLAKLYPFYGWEHNRGYATRDHLAALAQFGPSPAHRFSFEPVASMARRNLLA